jgi:GT2 family glycosyltransferase
MTSQTALFILGMHRSGTSALARVFSLLGAALPRHLLPPGPGNPLGHWEPEHAVALHDQVLAAAGTWVNDLHGPADNWFATPAASAFLAPMGTLIREEFADSPLFVFKNPRSALVFPLWRRVLAERGIRCLPIIMRRNPIEVARSLVLRQTQAMPKQLWNTDRGGLLWLRYMLAAERHSRGIPRAFCDYTELLADWQGLVARLADELGISWPGLNGAAPEIDRFLAPTHRHQQATIAHIGPGGAWSEWIEPTYRALGLARGSQGPDQAGLDAVARGFENACAALLPVHEPASPPKPVAQPPAASEPRRPDAARHVGLIVTAEMLDPHLRPWLAAIIAAMRDCHADMTVIPVGDFALASAHALSALAATCTVDSLPPDQDAITVEPGFLRETVALFRHLRSRRMDLLLFPDRGGLGHASIIAKQTGQAFPDTTLGVLACGASRWERERDRRFPNDLVALSIEHIEQQAAEHADLLLRPVAAAAQWMHAAGWRHRGAPVPPDAMSPDAMADVVAKALQAAVPAPEATTPVEVTVVITHYERPLLLRQNLQALQRQTDRDFSVIVVDDGSQRSESLLYLANLEHAYRDLSLRLIRQPNRYLGAARNTGIRAATTDFVILLDDDNLAFPTMVERLKHAVRCSGADIVTCGIRHFHDAYGPPDESGSSHGPDQLFAGGPVAVGAVHNCFGDASGIYRRAMIEQIGYFHERPGVTFEDWQLHLRAVVGGFRLLSMPEPLVWYRVRDDSMLRTTNRYDNARVIVEVVCQLPPAALEPVFDLLMGLEQDNSRLNGVVQAIRAVAAARIASEADRAANAVQHIKALDKLVEIRTEAAATAERYARSLEQALADARQAHDAAVVYARSLEEARAEAERYARSLEAELAKGTAGRACRP